MRERPWRTTNGAAWRIGVAVILMALTAVGIGGSAAASTDPEPPPPPVTVNEFIPEDRDLTDCLSALPKPGCGSEARGGWRQGLVFGALVLGLAIIGGRVAYGVRRRDRVTAGD
jgi:hypothetical protein